jgi:hypothetical protein
MLSASFKVSKFEVLRIIAKASSKIILFFGQNGFSPSL